MTVDGKPFYEVNKEFVRDLHVYYGDMEKELSILLDEALNKNRESARLYIFAIPLISKVSGIIINRNKYEEILFHSEKLKVIFGKEYYEKNYHRYQDLIAPDDDDFIKIYEEYGENLSPFPYVRRYGTASNVSKINEIYENLKVVLQLERINLSSQVIFSKPIQYGKMLVISAVDFLDKRYLQYKKDIDEVEKAPIGYKYYLDTVICNFLEKWCEHIYYGLKYTTIDFLANTQAILRASANDILQDRQLPHVDIIDALANAEYEGNCTTGIIRFHENDDQADSKSLLLHNPMDFEMDKIKNLRKFLEISHNNICVEATVGNSKLFGFGVIDKDDESYMIKFCGKNSWEFYKGKERILKCERGHYKIPVEISWEYVLGLLKNKFHDDFDEKVVDIILAAYEQKHGTIIVVSAEAEMKTKDLVKGGKGKQMREAYLSKACREMITSLCAIDGALMIDPYGLCEGIGLILPNDGDIKGDSSRGARYNSAKAYSFNNKNDLVCVISEDGMIDFM